MLREETDFIDDAIGIDPPGCGCTSCITGSSIPLDDTSAITELIRAHFEEGRKVIYRCGGTIILYRSRDGEYKHASLHTNDNRHQNVKLDLISPEPGYFDYSMDEGTVISDESTDPDEALGSVKTYDTSAMREVIEKHFEEREILVNRTSDTLVVFWNAYDEYDFILIDAEDDEPLYSVIYD